LNPKPIEDVVDGKGIGKNNCPPNCPNGLFPFKVLDCCKFAPPPPIDCLKIPSNDVGVVNKISLFISDI
jgi:hypothetical protein